MRMTFPRPNERFGRPARRQRDRGRPDGGRARPPAPGARLGLPRAAMAASVYPDQRLRTANGRRTMENALDRLAEILTGGKASGTHVPVGGPAV